MYVPPVDMHIKYMQ